MDNCNIDTQKLLSDKRVQAEIQRHLWIESEKVGHDIGFEKAKEDWLKRFSAAWMQYNMPESSANGKKTSSDLSAAENKTIIKKPGFLKRRRAKSYV
jgi:hypothetical protein